MGIKAFFESEGRLAYIMGVTVGASNGINNI